MKSILISIQPQWVEKILNGKKTIEIRKTMPKCELPCKVYIYCTKGKYNFFGVTRKGEELPYSDGEIADRTIIYKSPKAPIEMWGDLGKVVAEFTLNEIEILWQNNKNKTSTATVVDKAIFEKQTCMSWEQYCEYHKCKNGKYSNSYAWHIDDLKIYDKPKELSEFRKNLDCDDYPCNKGGKNSDCEYSYYDITEGCSACGIDFDGEHCIYKTIKRPPQSWCYVEECNNGKYCV